MKSEEIKYIRYRQARAGETLREAELTLKNGHLHGAVNRIYYACFYAVSALLLTDGLSSAKHSGVRSLFAHNWINTGKFPKEMGKFYHRIFEHRQKGDYDDLVTFSGDEVEQWFYQAKAFVREIAKRIEGQLQQKPEKE